ncbi:MAG: AMP-dependent synthetase, partial [Opitutales bacterium]|nr:AMP-dependent synthetase [Opitutales bacterium]
VETALAKALGLDKSELPLLAISSRLDVDKGEAIVLVSAVDLELARVKEALRQSGISNLWMPKYIVRTDKIPLLVSGKLDLKALSDLAKA